MESYDPLHSPDPDEWQSLGETERIELVEAYHRKARTRLPDEKIHATIHVIVENQIAMGDQIPVRATLERLMRQGLDRHDAVHAIGCVLMSHMTGQRRKSTGKGDPNEAYYQELKSLTPAKWRRDFG